MQSILKMGAWGMAVFLLLGVADMAQAQTELKQLGQNPFSKPELQTVEDFQEMVKQKLPDLKKGFANAGAQALFEDFVIQVDQSNIETVDVPIGEKLQWMIYKKDQRVQVMQNLVWAGKEPFKAFRLAVDQDNKRNIFLVPAICGNVALARTTTTPAPAPLVEEQPEPDIPPVVATPLPLDTSPLPVDTEKAALRRGQLVADIGFLHQPDPANYLLFRIGYDYRFHENFSLLGMVGYAPVIRGHDDTDSVMADLTANYHINRVYFGGGAGFWHSSMNDRLDLIVNTGYRIFGEPYQRNLSLFLEARAAVEEMNELKKYIRYGGGVRVHF